MSNTFSNNPTQTESVKADDGTSSAVGDTPNKAVRVNIVAGSGGAISSNQGTPNTLANAWPVKITDGIDLALVTAGGLLQVDGSGVTQPVSGTFFQATQPISAVSLPLPTGASTEATLALIKAKTDNLDVALSTRLKPADTLTAVTTVTAVTAITNALPTGANTIGKVDQGIGGASAWKVDGSAVTQPISAISLPLPMGASTLAAQTQPGVDIGDVTINNGAGAAAVNVQDGGNSLTVDNAALSVVGGGVEATALRVTIANDSTGVLSVDDNGGSLTIDTTQLPAALVNARLDINVGTWLGSTAPTIGSKTSENSVPVVTASDDILLNEAKYSNSLLSLILIELRTLTAIIGQGLNVQTNPDQYRNDPTLLN